MPRLLGVDIPDNKLVEFSLRYIYGVGPTRASLIVETLGLDSRMRASDLTEEQLSKISALIVERGYKVEGDLRREIAMNLKRLQAIQCYRGVRHRRGLPVRGQRTSTNARTRKGARRTVGVARPAGGKTATGKK
jgi:small subunit ribosomal protein S13